MLPGVSPCTWVEPAVSGGRQQELTPVGTTGVTRAEPQTCAQPARRGDRSARQKSFPVLPTWGQLPGRCRACGPWQEGGTLGDVRLPPATPARCARHREPGEGEQPLPRPLTPTRPRRLRQGIKCFHRAVATGEATALPQPRVPRVAQVSDGGVVMLFTHTVQKLKGTKIHRMQQIVNS